MKKITLSRAFTLIELLVVISIIAILAGIALPVFTTVQEKGAQTKDLSNAKQIGLSCKVFASDNDGKFPQNQVDASGNSTSTAVTSANEAFRNLVPQYVPQEKIFYLSKSAWTPNPPDENVTTGKILEKGENNFAYVTGISDTSNPSLPLIADGFKDGTPGTYSSDENAKGGVWKGKKAVIIRADMSGSVEKCDTNFQVFGSVGGTSKKNIFDVADNWLTTSNKVLNPE